MRKEKNILGGNAGRTKFKGMIRIACYLKKVLEVRLALKIGY